MPSSFTQNLGIEQPATGEQAGSWGVTANTSYATIDTAIAGSILIQLAAPGYTLQTSNGGAAQQGVYPLIIWQGGLSGQATVTIAPNSGQHRYTMQNRTTGGFAIAFTQGSGTQFVLQAGYDAQIYTDGKGPTANVAAAIANPQFANVLVTGNMSVEGSLTLTNPLTLTKNCVLQAGAQTIWWSPDNVQDFEAAAAQTSAGYALQLGYSNFGHVTLALDNAGRVGIGTVTPSTILDLRPAASVIQLATTLSALVSGSNNGGAIYFGGDVGTGAPLNATAAIETSWGGASTPQLAIGVIRDHVAANIVMDYAGDTYVRNGTTVHLAVLGNGQVGVNTATPAASALFHVSGGRSRFTDSEAFIICLENTGYPVTYIGTNASGQFQVSNNSGSVLLLLDQSGNLSTNLGITTGGTVHVTGAGNGIEFPDGTIQTTKATTSPAGIATMNWQLSGGNFCSTSASSNGAVGNFSLNGTGSISIGAVCGTNGINYNIGTTSDARLKRNIETLTGGLLVIDQIRPVRAEWNGILGHPEGRPLASVIAQEIRSVLPEAVFPFETSLEPGGKAVELLGLDPMAIVAHLILAVQQLKAKLEQKG